ncbi:MAG: chemotaxis protein CheW [Candidatus Kapaibacterium sp.]
MKHTEHETNHTQSDADINEQLQFVTFNLGDEEYAIEILRVQEIIRMIPITRVPNSPEFINGVINLRGKVIPVMDLGKRIGLPDKEKNNDNRIIVVEINHTIIGFIVDRVNIVLRVSKNIIENTPQLVGNLDTEYIKGIAKMEHNLLILLDLDKVMEPQELALTM